MSSLEPGLRKVWKRPRLANISTHSQRTCYALRRGIEGTTVGADAGSKTGRCGELRKLKVFRPSTLDLILTKMARGDENDLADIRFLLQQEKLSADQLRLSFDQARVPEVPEIHELFQLSQPRVLEMARALERRP